MTIGFSNGDFYKLFSKETQRFSKKYIKYYASDKLANAIELNCYNETLIDFLLYSKNIDLRNFNFISLHAPDLYKLNKTNLNKILKKLDKISLKYKINNFVFHINNSNEPWESLKKYKNINASIENMDNDKDFGKTINNMKNIIKKYGFNVTLDLQHCFTNDKSMKLAIDFQKKFKHKISEYHISGFKEKILHYSLFKTKQNIIIDSLLYKNIPIIIESAFIKIGEEKKEINYILKHSKSKI